MTETKHHADAWEVVANALAHADAVGAGVRSGWLLEIVENAVESADEGVVGLGPGIGEFSVAEINAPIVFDADVRPLTGGRSVAPFPDPRPKLEITERNCHFLATRLNVPLVHRASDIGQGCGVLISVLFAIPTLEDAEPHLSWVDIEGINLVIRAVTEGASSSTKVVKTDRRL